MPPPYPHFDLETSAILRGLADDRIVQIWEFWGDGEYPASRELKAEADRYVEEILDSWNDSDLAEFAKRDSWVRAGLATAGAVHDGDDQTQHLRRRLAMRIVEVGLATAEAELIRRTLDDPGPNDRAYREVPGLWQSLAERDFLLPLTPSRAPDPPLSADPYIEFGDFALFPNPYLRRERELWSNLCQMAHDERLTVQVAIDPFRFIQRDKLAMKLLEDYWFGLKVTRETLDSLAEHDLGSAFHWRNLDTIEGERNELFYRLIGTEFNWSKRDESIKTLQVDEIRPAPEDPAPDAFVLSRYLHSERDTQASTFIHLDGAIKAHRATTYRVSRENPLAGRSKAEKYRKLFRIDGEIPDGDWGMAVGHFFRGNELIAEHLGELVDERAEVG